MNGKKNKIVLITGGKGGIARGIASLLKEGYTLLLPDKDELDVSSLDNIKSYFEKIQEIDIVINNAGTIHPKSVEDSDPEKWVRDIKVNLVGPYYISKEALKKGCKVIINIASTAGYAAYKEWSSYCSSKAGLIAFTKSIAAEGVMAFAISPGATDTQFRKGLGLQTDNLMDPKEIGKVVLDIINKKYKSGDNIIIKKGFLEIR